MVLHLIVSALESVLDVRAAGGIILTTDVMEVP
jgi:hypothetical protein